MKFRVVSLRLQESKWGGYFLGIDFSPSVSTGIKVSKKRFLELTKLIKKEFSYLVIEK